MRLHVCATRSVPAHLRLYTQTLIALQTFSGHRPFHNFTDFQISMLVIRGQRPAHPSAEECGRTGLKDDVWKLIESCWDQQPDRRPIASEIVERLRSMRSVESEQQPSIWDDSFILQLRSTLRRPGGRERRKTEENERLAEQQRRLELEVKELEIERKRREDEAASRTSKGKGRSAAKPPRTGQRNTCTIM
jgi:hypothetical protein